MDKNRVRWDCIYTNPTEISRMKWYDFKINGDKVLVYGDEGIVFDYTIDQFKTCFTPEIGKMSDIFTVEKKEIAVDKVIK